MLRVLRNGPFTRIRMARTWLGRPIHDVSAYLLEDLLIDTGPPATAREFLAWCRHRPISRVALTHHHEDHVGGAAALRGELGVPVMAPPGALPILLEGARVPPYRRAVWGRPKRFRAEPLGDELEHGPYRFRVVPTPGHAFDHVCLFEKERGWLVSGDLYVHERVRYLRRIEIEDLWTHVSSLRRVLALEPELLICAHAGVVEDARGALRRKIEWWERLAQRVHELHREGESLRWITRRLLGREGFFFWFSLGDFSKKNLVRALSRSPARG
jgi:glyoxylase-like metal-dependent hydrolase (beta-lactamase superfamily II)